MKSEIYLLILLFSCQAVGAIPPEQVEFFESKIRAVLAESCYECHNSVNKKKAGRLLEGQTWDEMPEVKAG